MGREQLFFVKVLCFQILCHLFDLRPNVFVGAASTTGKADPANDLLLSASKVANASKGENGVKDVTNTLELSIAKQLSASDHSLLLEASSCDESNDGCADGGGLVWRDLAVIAPGSENEYIVRPCSGVVANGKICGLLGPSGAGKTSFLSALSGLIPSSVVRGNVWRYQKLDSQETIRDEKEETTTSIFRVVLDLIPPTEVAWLQQHDDFFTQLTVRETLKLAAFLELPHVPENQREILIQKTADSLNLGRTLDRQIGDYDENFENSHKTRIYNKKVVGWLRDMVKKPSGRRNALQGRLSGGERRRLSVALELLTDKQLFIADEPTSGLDSRMSAVVMNLIHRLAIERHVPAICSLHQPSSSIWQQLDTIILIGPGGRVCYAGDQTDAVEYFANLGYPLPKDTNPAEFLVDLMSVDSEDPIKAKADVLRIENLANTFSQYQKKKWAKTDSKQKRSKLWDKEVNYELEVELHHSSKATDVSHWRKGLLKLNRGHIIRGTLIDFKEILFGWIFRVGALLKRSWRQNTRDVTLNIFRILANVGNALLLTGIFPTVSGKIPLVNSIADRVALLSFAAINLGMLAYMKTVTLFAQEKPITKREQMRKQYSPAEYLIAKILAEIPLDCCFSILFTACLKRFSGLVIGWRTLNLVFSMLTTACASLGFLLGSVASNDQFAVTGGLPVLILFMVVGVINPSGVDLSKPPPLLVKVVKKFSPFAYAIEALCLGEYPGVVYQFEQERSSGLFSRLKNVPRMGGLALINTGDQVIEALGLNDQTYTGALQHMAWISTGNLAVTWLLLLWQQRREAKLRSHVVRDETEKTANSCALPLTFLSNCS